MPAQAAARDSARDSLHVLRRRRQRAGNLDPRRLRERRSQGVARPLLDRPVRRSGGRRLGGEDRDPPGRTLGLFAPPGAERPPERPRVVRRRVGLARAHRSIRRSQPLRGGSSSRQELPPASGRLSLGDGQLHGGHRGRTRVAGRGCPLQLARPPGEGPGGNPVEPRGGPGLRHHDDAARTIDGSD